MFKIKKKSNGRIDRYKIYHVAKGFHKQSVIDFSITFSLVVKPITICAIFSLIITNNWNIQ